MNTHDQGDQAFLQQLDYSRHNRNDLSPVRLPEFTVRTLVAADSSVMWDDKIESLMAEWQTAAMHHHKCHAIKGHVYNAIALTIGFSCTALSISSSIFAETQPGRATVYLSALAATLSAIMSVGNVPVQDYRHKQYAAEWLDFFLRIKSELAKPRNRRQNCNNFLMTLLHDFNRLSAF